MEIKLSFDELRKRKLMVATPMYGGACQGVYAMGLAGLAATCSNYGLAFKFYPLFNESLIQRARNYCVDEFLRSDCTHLMFIDSDIGFNPQDVIALLALSSPESEYDIIGGAYPKKSISWEKIKLACDKGMADEDPTVLEKYVGDYVFNPKKGTGSFKIDEPVEVSELGTGFMLIRRETFEKYAKAYPELAYRPDHARTEHFDGSREIHAYFDCTIQEGTRRYLSEDYNFCYKAQNAGMKTWLAPWIKLQHYGTMVFGGSIEDLAILGASVTVDPATIKRKKGKK